MLNRATPVVVSGVALVAALAALILSLAAISESDAPAYTLTSKSHEPGAYTKTFVEQALRRYDNKGRDAAIAHYNTAESVDGDWYVFIIDESGTIVSHATRPERRGLTFDDMVDVTGYNYGADFASTTENGRWVDYTYKNPASGNHEKKHSWVVRRDGLIFGSGWYDK